MRARSKRAPLPLNMEKRAPVSLAARSKSKMSRSTPISQWALGSKSNLRGSPQRRTSLFSLSSLPTTMLSLGILGSTIKVCFSSSSTAESASSSALISFDTAFISANTGARSSPAIFFWGILLETAFFLALRASTRPKISRRFSSRERAFSISAVKSPPRLFSAAMTSSLFSLMRLISSIAVCSPCQIINHYRLFYHKSKIINNEITQ